jgi:signal transduction histidine kinase
LRNRILIAIVSVTALAIVLFAVPFAFALSNLYREDEVVRLERAAAEAAARIPASFPTTSDPVELLRSHTNRVALYDRSGTRVAGTGPVIGDSLVVGSPLTRGEHVVGTLRVEAPISAVTSRTRNAILLMTGLGVLVVAVGAAIATGQARRLTRPVARLAHDAARLGDGDFTVQPDQSGIPELDVASNALATTAARLDQTLTRERNFSEDASHQLRTLLTGLCVTLEAARLDPSIDRDAALDICLGQFDRLDQTIEDLLALARERPTDRPAVDLGPLLASLEDDWHGPLAAESRPLRVITDPDVPWTKVSDRALRQILDVLVDNAWHHGAGQITVHARRASAGVVIEVTDEGDGFDAAADTIFARHRPSSTGHGIGLALARSLSEAEGLRLELVARGPHPVLAVFLPTSSTETPSDSQDS